MVGQTARRLEKTTVKKSDRTRRARDMAEHLGEAARERAEAVYEAAREKAEEVFDTAYETAENSFDDIHVFMKRQWRERPVAVAAAAVGLGVLIGMAMRGDRR